MRDLSFVLVVLAMLSTGVLFFEVARSETYTVGDEEEWNEDVDFSSWSKKYNFTLGDVLLFKYAKERHNVYEVTEPTYRSCNTSTGVIARYDSGEDEIKLTEPKKYWFLCDIHGHCQTGMRLTINVTEPTPEMGASPPPRAAASLSTRRCHFGRWSLGVLLVMGGILATS